MSLTHFRPGKSLLKIRRISKLRNSVLIMVVSSVQVLWRISYRKQVLSMSTLIHTHHRRMVLLNVLIRQFNLKFSACCRQPNFQAVFGAKLLTPHANFTILHLILHMTLVLLLFRFGMASNPPLYLYTYSGVMLLFTYLITNVRNLVLMLNKVNSLGML